MYLGLRNVSKDKDFLIIMNLDMMLKGYIFTLVSATFAQVQKLFSFCRTPPNLCMLAPCLACRVNILFKCIWRVEKRPLTICLLFKFIWELRNISKDKNLQQLWTYVWSLADVTFECVLRDCLLLIINIFLPYAGEYATTQLINLFLSRSLLITVLSIL